MSDPVCHLVYDLLPLYAENLTSPQAHQVIDAHLSGCQRCRAALAGLQERPPAGAAPMPEPDPVAAGLAFRLRRKVLVGSVLLVVLGMVIASVLLFVPVGVTESQSPAPEITTEGVDR